MPGEPLEVRLRRARSVDRPPTLLRSEHVWVRVPIPSFDWTWFPGVLSEWRQREDGVWQGHVTYAAKWWQESDREASHWSGFMSTEWVPAERIRAVNAEDAPARPEG